MKRFSKHASFLLYAITLLTHVIPESMARPGSSTKLNGSFGDGADIEDYEISADSKWVVYRADQDTDGVQELYTRPVAGSDSARKLNPPLVKGGNVEAYAISPDGAWVAFLAD